MWQPTRAQWSVIVFATLVLVLGWPPAEGPNLAVKAVRWLVDPVNTLPTRPEPLPMGLGDDGDAVTAHDAQEAEYFRVRDSSAWTKRRLELKVVEDPFDPSTERQMLVGFEILCALGVWRLSARKDAKRS